MSSTNDRGGKLHLIKLCVGADSVEDLERWQASTHAKGPDGLPRHVTRMWPKRGTELLDGGSLYWVIKGVVSARQRLLRLDALTDEEGIRRCALVLEPQIVRTAPQPKRPFQGWRYLCGADVPADLGTLAPGEETLPPRLSAALAELGVLPRRAA